MDANQQKQMEEHDSKHDGVYLVEIFLRDKFIQHGIFTDSKKGMEWINSWPNEYTCLMAPFILDNPDKGTIPDAKQN